MDQVQDGVSDDPVGRGSYRVREGDCVASIAAKHGLFWETIWDHPENADLRRAREDPNVLLPGDRVFIPEIRPHEESGEAEARHRFRRRGVPEMLRIVAVDEDGEPRRDTPYQLSIDGNLRQGTTDSEGLIEEGIPPGAREGVLRVGEGDDLDEYDLELGKLDPRDTPTGVQDRLANLGYDVGPIDGDLGERTRDALAEFQESCDLEPTGNCDEETLAKLEERARD